MSSDAFHGSSAPSAETDMTVGRHEHETMAMHRRSDEDQMARDIEKAGLNLENLATPDQCWLVTWDGPDDPENPMNWPLSKKLSTTAILTLICLVCTFASSIFSTAQHSAGVEFGVPDEVMNFGTALFLFGYAVGPPIFAPLSELFGRKIPLILGYFLFAIFTIAGATAKDVQTLMLTRFFGGMCGSSPLVLTGAIFADYWHSDVRGVAVCLYSLALFIGPSVAPVMGSFVVQSYLGWRWVLYLTAFMAFFMLIIGVFFYEESFGNTILSRRAAMKRYTTGNFAWHHKSEEKPLDPQEIISVYLLRPFTMLCVEPIVLALSIYVAFAYAILYLMLEAIPITFHDGRGWSTPIATLPFISIIVGCTLGSVVILGFNPYYVRQSKLAGGKPVPKARLPPMIIGGLVFPLGFFVYAWTGDLKNGGVFWLAPCIGLVLIGFGIILIFLQSLNYLIDVYLMYAASALAANTIVRSALAGIFPLVAGYMFRNMKVKWASTLLGLLSVLMAPIPILFWRYDSALRRHSRFTLEK